MSVIPQHDIEKFEQRALKFSILGALLFAVIGISYGLYTHSQSILFDGVYSCISLVMSMVTLWVSKLVVRPGDKHFQFGYTHLEPLLNVIKAMIIGATCIYAFTEGLASFLSGGRNIDLSAAIVYACISTIGSLGFGGTIYYYANKVNSKLAKVDAVDWLFDGLLSAGILLGFVGAYQLQDSRWSEYIPYLDPLLVIVLVTLFIPIPLRIFRDNIREVLWLAPSTSLQTKISESIEHSLVGIDYHRFHLRMAKVGREFNLSVYVIMDKNEGANTQQFDQIRSRISDSVDRLNTDSHSVWLEVMFTADERWVFD